MILERHLRTLCRRKGQITTAERARTTDNTPQNKQVKADRRVDPKGNKKKKSIKELFILFS